MGALKRGKLMMFLAVLLTVGWVLPVFGAQKTVDQYIKEGKDSLNANNIEAAMVSFGKALQLDPKSATALFFRGNAFCKQGSYENAIADYSEAIRLDPKNGKAYNNRAVAYWYNNQPFKARADLNIAEMMGAPVNKKVWQELMDSEKPPTDLTQYPSETITGVFEVRPKGKSDDPAAAKP